MTLTYTAKSGGAEKEVRVQFDPPLLGYEEVKPRLISMKVDAEEALGMVRMHPPHLRPSVRAYYSCLAGTRTTNHHLPHPLFHMDNDDSDGWPRLCDVLSRATRAELPPRLPPGAFRAHGLARLGPRGVMGDDRGFAPTRGRVCAGLGSETPNAVHHWSESPLQVSHARSC